VAFNSQPHGKSKEIEFQVVSVCKPNAREVVYFVPRQSCLRYTSLINRLHNLSAVVKAVTLGVFVKRGKYRAVCNNCSIMENYSQSGPNAA
jgi:hypothetical protein